MGFAHVVWVVVAPWSQGGAALCPGLSHLAPLGQWICPDEFTYADQHHFPVVRVLASKWRQDDALTIRQLLSVWFG
jgi:glutathione S-transferase